MQVLRGHLTPILAVEKELYETTSGQGPLFYTGGLDGVLKAWKAVPGNSELTSLKDHSQQRYELASSVKVSSEPVWEIASSPVAVVSGLLSHFS